MSRLRFLLDEHMPRAIQDQLLRLSPDIEALSIGQPEAPAKGTVDLEILRWTERTGYVLVTANRRTIPRHLRAHFDSGGHIPGLLFIKRGVSLGVIIEHLYLLWATTDAEEFQDQIFFIPF